VPTDLAVMRAESSVLAATDTAAESQLQLSGEDAPLTLSVYASLCPMLREGRLIVIPADTSAVSVISAASTGAALNTAPNTNRSDSMNAAIFLFIVSTSILILILIKRPVLQSISPIV
jgi:hypothetical protein